MSRKVQRKRLVSPGRPGGTRRVLPHLVHEGPLTSSPVRDYPQQPTENDEHEPLHTVMVMVLQMTAVTAHTGV